MDGSGTSSVADTLEHFGVRGMKWGVRRTDAQLAKASGKKEPKMSKLKDAKGDAISKDDVKWSKAAGRTKEGIKAYNQAAKKMNDEHIERINNKPEYKNQDFTKDSPTRQKYYKEYGDTFLKEFSSSLKEQFGESPSGKYTVQPNPDGGPSWYVGYKEDATHADDKVFVHYKTDDQGYITEISIDDDVLEHYGVKGMKWGVRRTAAQLRKSRGDNPKSKSSIKKLSDEELNKRLKRKENEKKLHSLEKTTGQQTAEDILGGIGKKALKHVGTGVAIYAGKQLVNVLLGNGPASFIPKPKK